MQLDDAFPITFRGLHINYGSIASSAEIKCAYSRVISIGLATASRSYVHAIACPNVLISFDKRLLNCTLVLS